MSAADFQLKGTGWYQTDFKNSRVKPEAKKETKEIKETKEVPATKDDTVAVPKTETKAESGGASGSGGSGTGS